MEKNQTLQVTDLQKKKQQVLEQLYSLLDYQDVKKYKEWLIQISCFLMLGADRDSDIAIVGGISSYPQITSGYFGGSLISWRALTGKL